MSKGQEYNLRAIFSCVDKVSPALKRIQPALKNLQKSFRSVSRVAGNAARSIAMPASLLSGALGYSFTAAVSTYAQYADGLAAVSQKSGVAAKKLQELRYAAMVNGSSAETMDAALVKLNATLYDAAYGKNKDAAALFKTLGISIKNADGSAKSAADVMPKLAEALRLNENAAVRTKMAMTLFGKSGTELLPLLTQGSNGLDNFAERAKALGLVMSDDAVKAGGDLNNTFAEVKQSLLVTTAEIVKGALPAISDIAEKVMKWMAANREVIGQKLAEWLQKFADGVKAIPWDKLEWVAQGIIALKVGQLAAQVTMAAASFTAFAGPIGIAVGLLAGAGAAIYMNWDKISAYFKDVWTDITGYFEGAWKSIKAIVDKLSGWVPDWLKDFFGGGGGQKNVQFVGASAGQNIDNDAFAGDNAAALGLSAAGQVGGEVTVHIDQGNGVVQDAKVPLTGAVRVGGNPGIARGFSAAYAGGGF